MLEQMTPAPALPSGARDASRDVGGFVFRRGWETRRHDMLFTVAMFPVGDGASLRKPVASVIDEIDQAGLHYEVSAGDTVIEGEWDAVMPVIRRAEERLRAAHERVFMVLTLDDHVGVENRLHTSAEDVETELHRTLRH